MEQFDFDLGEGTVYVLGDLADWANVPAKLRALVPDRMRTAWGESADTFREWSASATHRGLKKWLSNVAETKCRLRLYDTAPLPRGFGRAAFLDVSPPSSETSVLLDFRSREIPSAQYPPPRSTHVTQPLPQALREVHERVGGIQHDFGMSGTLVPPDALAPITEWWPEIHGVLDEMSDEELRELGGRSSLAELDRCLVVYESSLNFLCVHEDGTACWIAIESGVYARVDLSTTLDAYFDALLEGRAFGPG